MMSDSQISEREREILRLVATGATNQQIAHQLNISINTVKVHLRNIFGKIGAASRTEATVYAIQQGLVNLDRHADMGEAPQQTATLLSDSPSKAITSVSTLPDASSFAIASIPESPTGTVAVNPESLARAESGAVDAEQVSSAPTASKRRNVFLPIFAAVGLLGVLALVYTQLQQRPNPPAEATAIPTIATQSSRWKSRAPLAQPRTDFGVVPYDGKLYVIGGSSATGASAAVERYDPTNNIWVPLDDKPTAASHVQAAVVRGLIYVPGGEGANGKILTVFEAYDPRNQHWESLPPLPEQRSQYALASVEGRLYLFGGWDGGRSRVEVFVYDPDSNRWSNGAPLRTPRRNAGAIVVEGRIYVIGGENESGSLRVDERYDPNGNGGGQWDSAAPLPFAIATPAVTSFVGNVLVFDPQKHAALQYSPTADAWTPIDIPEDIGVSSRTVSLNNTSVFLFGSPDGAPGAISEYQAYNLFLPNTGAGP